LKVCVIELRIISHCDKSRQLARDTDFGGNRESGLAAIRRSQGAFAALKTIVQPIDELPNDADIRDALSRIIASNHISKSPQLANFLRFVVEEKLAGNGSRIKAYTIAADALGRDSSFDPQNDPIVRVEAGRLRRALDQYYMNGGSSDPVVIELPRGHYVPVFRANNPRRSFITRFHAWRRQTGELARDNLRLVVLIAVVATAVSLGFDLLWMLLAKLG
jgi:hypothetical protein